VLTLNEIIIEDPVLKGQTLCSKVTTNDLGKFLKTRELFVEYDSDISVNDSLLTIPLTATVLPLAWLTGSDIYVSCIDRSFKESMDKLQNYFKSIYPRAPFTTDIHAEELLENKIEVTETEKKTGLLFSGGADSMYSLLTNMHLKPRMIMFWGIDDFSYPERKGHWDKTINIYREFAERKNLDFNLVKTNISQILDNRRIGHRFYRELYNGEVRVALQHSLILLPILAPLSMERFNHVIIAASFIPSYDFSKNPRAAVPKADEQIKWADLTVKHDGFTESRNDKIIGAISDYIKIDNLTLRVCLRSPLNKGSINDSTCEKCLRTIASLTLAGVDPNICGFHVDDSTFRSMKIYWENARFSHPGYHWNQIKNSIPAKIEHDIYGSKKFFDWFRDFDFMKTEKNWFYVDLYNSLPYKIAKQLDKAYQKLGINVHQEPVIRENT
jgi:hypothetical protein